MGKTHNITVRFTEEQLKKLRVIGEEEVRPVANLVCWIVAQWLDRRDQPVTLQENK